jgi:hypothetical protein
MCQLQNDTCQIWLFWSQRHNKRIYKTYYYTSLSIVNEPHALPFWSQFHDIYKYCRGPLMTAIQRSVVSGKKNFYVLFLIILLLYFIFNMLRNSWCQMTCCIFKKLPPSRVLHINVVIFFWSLLLLPSTLLSNWVPLKSVLGACRMLRCPSSLM